MFNNWFQHQVSDSDQAELDRLASQAEAIRLQEEAAAGLLQSQRKEDERICERMRQTPQYKALKKEAEHKKVRDVLEYLYSLKKPTVQYFQSGWILPGRNITRPLDFKYQMTAVSSGRKPKFNLGPTVGFHVSGFSDNPSERFVRDHDAFVDSFSFTIQFWIDEKGTAGYGLAQYESSEYEGNFSETVKLVVFPTLEKLFAFLIELCSDINLQGRLGQNYWRSYSDSHWYDYGYPLGLDVADYFLTEKDKKS